VSFCVSFHRLVNTSATPLTPIEGVPSSNLGREMAIRSFLLVLVQSVSANGASVYAMTASTYLLIRNYPTTLISFDNLFQVNMCGDFHFQRPGLHWLWRHSICLFSVITLKQLQNCQQTYYENRPIRSCLTLAALNCLP
jgi:hypothetical protein